MKTQLFIVLICSFFHFSLFSQAIYVDSQHGNDNSEGSIKYPVQSIHKAVELIQLTDNNLSVVKINPGIYVLNHPVMISSNKNLNNTNRIIIEASILPDDSTWTPEKMPVILSTSNTGEIMSDDGFLKDNWITGFYVNESHVTIRGLKFNGYSFPGKIYYPITRFNKSKSDLLVEQCMFLGEPQSSSISVGVIAHGDSVRINRCIFYKVGGTVVYWQDSENGTKTGNGVTNSIMYDCGSAVYCYTTDKDFIFKNNVVANCKMFWCKGVINSHTYSVDNCVVVNYEMYKSDGDKAYEYDLIENEVIKEGSVSLRVINSAFEEFPVDHLNVLPETLGFELGAGIFNFREFE